MLSGLRILPNGSQHARVGKAAAENAAERGADFVVGSFGLSVQNGFGGEDDTAEAKAALRGAFLNEGFLKRVGAFGCAQTVQGYDFGLTDGADRQYAGAHHLAVHYDRACSALRHSAAEARSAQREIVSQDEQQRRVWVDGYGVLAAVDF